jgi:hypothetical protein
MTERVRSTPESRTWIENTLSDLTEYAIEHKLTLCQLGTMAMKLLLDNQFQHDPIGRRSCAL